MAEMERAHEEMSVFKVSDEIDVCVEAGSIWIFMIAACRWGKLMESRVHIFSSTYIIDSFKDTEYRLK